MRKVKVSFKEEPNQIFPFLKKWAKLIEDQDPATLNLQRVLSNMFDGLDESVLNAFKGNKVPSKKIEGETIV